MLRLVSAAALLYLIAPIIVVVASAFGTAQYPVFPPSGFTLHWFAKLLGTAEMMEAARISAILSTTSTVIACIIGTLSALALVRCHFPGRRLMSVVVLSPILVPAIILGLALLVVFHRMGLYQTLPGLVAAHTVLVTPFVIRLVMASLAEFDPMVEEAARNLGAGWWRTFFLVTLPLIRPGVLAGAIFAFIISFDELVVTLFLAGPGLQTLPIRIFTSIEYSSDPTISAVSTCLIAMWLAIGVPVYMRFLSVRYR